MSAGRYVTTTYRVPRESVFIVTKVEETDNAYEAVRRNLSELQLDYADLILIHRPPKEGVGEELWRSLIRARQDGLVRDIGVSNYSEQQIQTLVDLTGVKPVVNQVEWSPFGWSRQMRDFCDINDIVIQAYSPLTRAERLDDGALRSIGERYDKTPAQVLIRWNLQHGWVPLPKAETSRHIEENIEIFDFELEPADMNALDGLDENFSALAEQPIYQLNR